MPAYTYQCESCRHSEEHVHGMNESPRFACPACGGLTHRVPGRAALVKADAPESEAPSAPEPPGPGCALHHHHHGGCGH